VYARRLAHFFERVHASREDGMQVKNAAQDF
jgi:hypothetical protein